VHDIYTHWAHNIKIDQISGFQNTDAPRMISANNNLVKSLVGATVAFGIALLFMWPTARSIVQIWNSSDTFTHGYLVLPVFIYMVWHNRQALALCTGKTEWRVIPLIALFSALWLVSQQAGIQVAEHTALVVILILTIWAVTGNEIAKTIRYPLAFLIFLAPIGDELVPSLMELTADVTVWAIVASGIPVHREGLYFSLPSGNWSVVEACSGIRYLIASVVLGSVYAYLNYRSYKRRLLFLFISVLVPIIANAARAYLIVMLGHLSGNELATGVDHLVYGWLFFGIVMFAMFSLGATFSETDATKDQRTTANFDHIDPAKSVDNRSSHIGFFAVLLFALAAAPAWSSVIKNKKSQVVKNLTNEQIENILPKSQETQAGTNSEKWEPIVQGYAQKIDRIYLTSSRAKVRAMAFVYLDQSQGQEMISSVNRLTKGIDSQWRITNNEQFPLANIDNKITGNIDKLELQSTTSGLAVRRWYSINGRITNSPMKAKLIELGNQLSLKSNTSVHYILATDNDNLQADTALNEIVKLILIPNE